MTILYGMGYRPGTFAVETMRRLLRAQQAALGEVEAALMAAALPPLSWCEVLLALQHVGRAGIRAHALEPRLLLAHDAPSQLLAEIEAEGYLQRRPRGGGGRVLVITPAGEAILKRIWPVYETTVQGAAGAHMTHEEASALAEVLGGRLTAPAD